MIGGLSIRLKLLLIFAVLGVGAVIAVNLALVWGAARAAAEQAVGDTYMVVGIVASFAILALTALIWTVVDSHLARPIDRLTGELRARAQGQVKTPMPLDAMAYMGDLARAAQDVTQRLTQAQGALTDFVDRETRAIASQKDWLEALLDDVPAGVLLCSNDHKLVFYNGKAVDLLGGMDAQGQGPALDRSVFDYLHEPPVRHAFERLMSAYDRDGASDLLCSAKNGGAILGARMRLLGHAGQTGPTTLRVGQPAFASGYVLTLHDVSRDLAAQTARDQLIDEMFERVRRPAAAIRSLVGVLTEADGPQGEAREKIRSAAHSEAGQLSSAIHELSTRREALRDATAALGLSVRASDLLDAVRAQIFGRTDAPSTSALPDLMVVAAPLILRCDGFSMVSFLSSLLRMVQKGDETAPRRGFRLEIVEEGAGAMISLEWDGPPLPLNDLERWLDLAVMPAAGAGPSGLQQGGQTGRQILTQLGTDIWPERIGGQAVGFNAGDPQGERGRICLPVRSARRAVQPVAALPRRAAYDFDLLNKSRNTDLHDTLLDDLVYVVFDTETTGLHSERGDEICQIAAVRIVNGRRIGGEVFDTLVNPQRPIPSASTKVHGITDAMVSDAPMIAQVGPQFHAFAQDAVLVAHNAPFDLAFLRRRSHEMGVEFDHPVLDTVLLSAVIYGQSEVHSLDALTHRLGITIPQEVRHTALGDTVATAEAFLKLLPALKARGIATFGDVVAAQRQHGRLLKDMNS
ncbi:exonuclease domain-containing protein [Albirhodobacter sp. R86504]|uniref:3'-5' exonuclease n=1 Tax=Albirhodobacter sp. R86504 TaxID=3093848 RepID=UPI0036726B54